MDKVSLFEGVFFKKNIAILKIKFLENQFNLLGIYKVMQKTKKRLNAPSLIWTNHTLLSGYF